VPTSSDCEPFLHPTGRVERFLNLTLQETEEMSMTEEMSTTLVVDPLEKYLVKSILFIDNDQPSVDFLVGVLANLSADPRAGQIIDAIVPTLDKAQAYIDTKKPYIIIIDPRIDSVANVLDFMVAVQAKHPATQRSDR
jgi:hypothetical protein